MTVRQLGVALLLVLTGCTQTPESYPIPPQHQPIVAPVADADGRFATKLLNILTLQLALSLCREDYQLTGNADQLVPGLPERVAGDNVDL